MAAYEDEWEEPQPDALPGHASVEHMSAHGLEDVVLSLIGEVCKLQVALRDLDQDELDALKPRLDTLRWTIDGLSDRATKGPRRVKVVGFKPPTKPPAGRRRR